jgi:hypothetical protein
LTFRSPNTSLSTSTFCWACIWKRNSLPRRRRGHRARLALGQDHELDAGGVEQLREGLGGLLGAVLQGTGTADPVEVLDVCRDRVLAVGPEDADREVALLDPGVAAEAAGPTGCPCSRRS